MRQLAQSSNYDTMSPATFVVCSKFKAFDEQRRLSNSIENVIHGMLVSISLSSP
jgi:hypothetical protein